MLEQHILRTLSPLRSGSYDAGPGFPPPLIPKNVPVMLPCGNFSALTDLTDGNASLNKLSGVMHELLNRTEREDGACPGSKRLSISHKVTARRFGAYSLHPVPGMNRISDIRAPGLLHSSGCVLRSPSNRLLVSVAYAPESEAPACRALASLGSDVRARHPLSGRDVLIWPDNDKAGIAALRMVEKSLSRIKQEWQDIVTVDEHWLRDRFPKGWNLADPVSDWGYKDGVRTYGTFVLQNAFLSSMRAGEREFGERKALMDVADTARRFYTGELSSRGLCPFGRVTVYRTVKAEEAYIKEFEKDPQICTSGDLSKSLARQCTLFKLRCGRDPDLSELHIMRDTIRERGGKEFDRYGEFKTAIKQRVLSGACERSLAVGRVVGPEKTEGAVAEMQAKELLVEKPKHRRYGK